MNYGILCKAEGTISHHVLASLSFLFSQMSEVSPYKNKHPLKLMEIVHDL